MKFNIPSLAQIEAEMIRRGIEVDDDKAIPTEDDADLPPVVAAADRLEGTLRRVWLSAMKNVAKAVPVDDLARAMPSGQAGPVFGQWIKKEMENQAKPGTAEMMRAGWMKGAEVGVRQLRPLGIEMRSATISFNVVNAQAISWAAQNSGRLITEVTDDQILAVSTLISESIQTGRTVEQTARDIRTVIGLRSDQIATLTNFRADLVEQGLDPDVIARRFERRASGMLASRSRIIARTEIVDAANAGQRGLWNQAAQDGLIDKNKTYKVWVTTQDDLAEDCEPLDGESVLLDDQFDTDSGMLDGPPKHPNCRCGLNVRFVR